MRRDRLGAKEREGVRDVFCCCWVNVLKIVVKFIGYENLMICKVADKHRAPPGDRGKQQQQRQPKPTECERILGIYSNINICFFIQPIRVIGIAIVAVELMKTLLAKVFPRILGATLKFSPQDTENVCTRNSVGRKFSLIQWQKKIVSKFLYEILYFLRRAYSRNSSPIRTALELMKHLCLDTHVSVLASLILSIMCLNRFP